MALGARANEVTRMIVRQGITLSGLGVGLGLTIAFALRRFLIVFLYATSPTDWVAFLVAPTTLFAVAVRRDVTVGAAASNRSASAHHSPPPHHESRTRYS